MAARLRQSHQDDIRAKIKVDRLIEYLHCGIFGTKYQNKQIELTATKVSAITLLLNKTLPTLSNTELTGKDGEALAITYSNKDANVL